MRISVELIPRGEAKLLSDVRSVLSAMPQVDAVNIPDLIRFPMRSWDACKITGSIIPNSIPHIRAIDISPERDLHVLEAIRAAGLQEILIVRGDPPHDMRHRTYPNSSEDIIRRFKQICPSLKIYAAFDPYRLGFCDELTAVRRKTDAGADGFFTQPIFDIRLLELCADMLVDHEVFWGIAPVIGNKSKSYWEATNQVVFPSGFTPNMEWNIDFALKAISTIQQAKGNVYFMPIRVDLTEYLTNFS